MSLIEPLRLRWIFALYEGWHYRERLKKFLTDPLYRIGSLTEITGKKLDEANIAVLILDFDGVLANHGAEQPLPEVEVWLKQLCLEIGEWRVAILTNKPFPKRKAYFAKHFPLIHVVEGVRKKPYPDGIIEVANYKGVEAHRLVLVDDRILTGMLATCLSSSQGWYFFRPYANFWQRPVKELFFSLLRVVERWVFRLG